MSPARTRVVVVLLALGFLSSVLKAQSPTHAVLIVHRVTNAGKGVAPNVKAVCILPGSNTYQEVSGLEIEPAAEHSTTDAENQQVITVSLGDIPAGESRAVYVLAWAKLKNIYIDLLGQPRRMPTTLPAEIEAGELSDGWLLQLRKVRPIAEKATSKARDDLDHARAAFEFLTREATYDIDDKFESAEKILNGAPASCSELAYTYVAMCRSLGIPARIVSAYVNRDGVAPSTDWRTHRWVEFYSRKFGWVPADPTNRINEPSKTYFGRQDGKYLTVIDDGVPLRDSPDPAWEVFIAGSLPATRPAGASTSRPVPAFQLELSRSAVWRVSANKARETKLFHEACEALRSADVDARKTALGAWTHQREVMSFGYVMQALFDPNKAIRLQAVAALARSNDVTLLIPLAILASQEKDPQVKKALLATASELLHMPPEARRAQAVAELAKSRTPEALELLNDIWLDPSRDVRKAVVLTFYKFGDKPAVHDAYRRLSSDPDEYIRVTAALRWSRVGSVEADGLLVDMLQSDVQWDREHALQELARRTGDKYGLDPSKDPKLGSTADAIGRWQKWLETRKQQPASATAP